MITERMERIIYIFHLISVICSSIILYKCLQEPILVYYFKYLYMMMAFGIFVSLVFVIQPIINFITNIVIKNDRNFSIFICICSIIMLYMAFSILYR